MLGAPYPSSLMVCSLAHLEASVFSSVYSSVTAAFVDSEMTQGVLISSVATWQIRLVSSLSCSLSAKECALYWFVGYTSAKIAICSTLGGLSPSVQSLFSKPNCRWPSWTDYHHSLSTIALRRTFQSLSLECSSLHPASYWGSFLRNLWSQ